MSLVATINRGKINENRPLFAAKMQHPELFYGFPGLDHSEYWLTGKTNPKTLASQVERMRRAGMDGFKLLEGKPTTVKILPVPADSPYLDDFFSECERTGMPLLWHVADPEEFWDPAKTPKWALSRGWGYGPGDVPKETLYAQVDNVLARHPKLKVIFAHFYFLSADLPRARAFLNANPSVGIDLAPGVEMLHNLSTNVEKARDFFIEFQDRIYFGTDLSNGLKMPQAIARSGIVTRFLETDDAYPVPKEADFLLGKPEDGEIKGMSLPKSVVGKIEWKNFEKLAGKKPHKPNESLLREISEELELKVKQLAGHSGV